MKRKRNTFYFHRIFISVIIFSIILLFPLIVNFLLNDLQNELKKSKSINENISNQKILDSLNINSDSVNFASLLKDSLAKSEESLQDSIITLPDSSLSLILEPQQSIIFLKKIITNLPNIKLIVQHSNQVKTTYYILAILLIIAYIMSIIFILKFKKFFKLKYNDKEISSTLQEFIKKYIWKTPFMFSLIYFMTTISLFSYIINSNYNIYLMDISLLILLLTIFLGTFFIYSWQNYRLKFYYLQEIFSIQELNAYQFKKAKTKIKYIFISYSLIAIIIPITITIFYLFLCGEEIYNNLINLKAENMLITNYLEILKSFKNIDINNTFILNYSYIFSIILMLTGVLNSLIISVISIVIFFKWNINNITIPLQELTTSIKEISQKPQDIHTLPIKGNDEIGMLTRELNKMSFSITEDINNMATLNKKYLTLFPTKLLELLNQNDFTQFKAGDCLEIKSTIMIAHLNNYSSLFKDKNNLKMFKMLNHIVNSIEKEISSELGFIYQYNNHNIIAIFPENSEYSLRASEKIFRTISDIHRKLDKQFTNNIDLHIGISTEKITLGILGSTKQLIPTIIHPKFDNILNLVKLNQKYKTKLLIDQKAYTNLPKTDDFKLRELFDLYDDTTYNKVYEVLDILHKTKRDKILKSDLDFQEGLLCYQDQDFQEAEIIFTTIWKNFADYPAKILKEKCHEKNISK